MTRYTHFIKTSNVRDVEQVEELGRLLVKIRGEYIPDRNGVDQRNLKTQIEQEGAVLFNELVSVNPNYSASQFVRPSGACVRSFLLVVCVTVSYRYLNNAYF